MSKKFLGRMVAGAALGGASLLLIAPGVAAADIPKKDRGENFVYADPPVVKAGDTTFFIQICEDPEKKPSVFSEPTGEVFQEPRTKLKKKKHFRLFDGEGGEAHVEPRDDKKVEPKKVEPKKVEPKKVEPKKVDPKRVEPKEPRKFHHDEKKFHHDEKKFHHDEKKFHHDKEFDFKDKKFKKDKFDFKDHPFAYFAEVKIPKKTEPGTYKLFGSCGGVGKFVVAPHGWAEAGDGGATSDALAVGEDPAATSTVPSGLMVGGAGLLAAATLGGTALLRRRGNNESVA